MEKLNVGIFVFDDVEVLDFCGPFEVFSRARTVPGPESRRSEESAPFRVFTVARDFKDPVVATGGLRILADFDFDTAPGIDVLVIPGGFGTRDLLDETFVLDWIRWCSGRARLTCSVCTGSLLLAKAGLLNRRRATTHWGALDVLSSLGEGIKVDRKRRFVDDGIVTSAGVSAGIDMALYLVERLCGRAISNDTAKFMDYRS